MQTRTFAGIVGPATAILTASPMRALGHGKSDLFQEAAHPVRGYPARLASRGTERIFHLREDGRGSTREAAQ